MVQLPQAHCAFCYKICCIGELQKCGGCRKRKYCSRECQKLDWSDAPSARGQRHKIICKLGCGEEGYDWEVRHISDAKGLGMIALRDFARGERILAEREIDSKVVVGRVGALSPTEALALEDLVPKGGSMLDKVNSNAVSTEDGSGVCIRLSRVNHACVPNACHYDEYKGIKLLIARTSIAAGEEITFSYLMWYNLQGQTKAGSLPERLNKWRIKCPPDCGCQDPELVAKVEDAQRRYARMQSTLQCGLSLPASDLHKLNAMAQDMEFSHVNEASLYYAYHAFYERRGDRARAVSYARKALDMNTKVYGAGSESVQFDKGLISRT